MTDIVSITKSPPATANTISCFKRIDITANEAPKDWEPVSPINIEAGLELNHKKPSNAPIDDVQKITNSPDPFV